MPLAEGGVEWASGSGLVPGDALAYDSLSLPSVSKTPHVLENTPLSTFPWFLQCVLLDELPIMFLHSSLIAIVLNVYFAD